MIKIGLCAVILLAMASLPLVVAGSQAAGTVSAIVSTQWLTDNMNTTNLVILDVRAPDDHLAGHIPGSVNVPGLGNFYVNLFCEKTPWMELPKKTALFTTIGNAGIGADSLVIVVGRTCDPMAAYAMADAARVAMTLLYAGVEKVAILDGGYDKWAEEEKPTSMEPVRPSPVTYAGTENSALFVSKNDVKEKIGKSILIDARDSEAYFGLEQSVFESRPGHIPSAKNLPSPWFWRFTRDKNGGIRYGTYKDPETIREIATAVIGPDMTEEVVAFCGVGGYASTMYYVLTQMVGYRNVKIYDGSMQDWTADPGATLVKYTYQ